MTPEMKKLDCLVEIDAKKYLELFDEYVLNFTKQYGVVSVNFKPLPIAEPEVYEKQKIAKHTLKLNYWQMSFEDAKRLHRDLPLRKWESKRKEMGVIK